VFFCTHTETVVMSGGAWAEAMGVQRHVRGRWQHACAPVYRVAGHQVQRPSMAYRPQLSHHHSSSVASSTGRAFHTVPACRNASDALCRNAFARHLRLPARAVPARAVPALAAMVAGRDRTLQHLSVPPMPGSGRHTCSPRYWCRPTEFGSRQRSISTVTCALSEGPCGEAHQAPLPVLPAPRLCATGCFSHVDHDR